MGHLPFEKWILVIFLVDKACASNCLLNNVDESALYIFKKQAMKSQCGP